MATPREENAKKAARRRFEAREFINNYKRKHKCADCNQPWHPCQLDFFRLNGGPRKAISRGLLRSKDAILRDMQKCILVCANCARLRNYKAQRVRRSGPT